MSNSQNIKPLKIKELFKSNDVYRIPIYQRNYAWGKGQVEQLIQDILDFSEINKDKIYYIGTLVVYERKENNSTIYETIDGQQRLTTLSILLSVLNFNFKPILSYESRETSNKTFEAIYNKVQDKESDIFKDVDNYNTTMKNAYETIKSSLNKIKEAQLQLFKDYLLNYVEILRVSVPPDTDLNHYFEIMNNRGEQLEKHEVLKSKMLSIFKEKEKERKVFTKIWDACSDMSRYVQYGFSTNERDIFFSKNWNKLNLNNFDDILKNFELKESENNTEQNDNTLESIISKEDKIKIQLDEEKKVSERFTSPINFQNFLLHVLRIQVMNSEFKEDITLDDKRLINSFNKFINHEDFVKEFSFNLLKLRFLFDNYIIKRDYNENKEDGKWSLLKAYKYEYKPNNQKSVQYSNSFGDENNEQSNKQIIMILSMFHVSNPSMIYKHWLSGVLNYLYQQNINDIKADEYIDYLEDLAKKFFERYISNNEIDYREIIFSSNEIDYSEICPKKLDNGTNVENFIFNYLDYLLWKRYPNEIKDFSFTFKSSVEHVYPQHPKDGQKELPSEILNSFGNLCLISASKNSALSNYQPIAKKEHYSNTSYDSLKQKLMMQKADSWNEDEIKVHQDEMMKVLGLTNESK